MNIYIHSYDNPDNARCVTCSPDGESFVMGSIEGISLSVSLSLSLSVGVCMYVCVSRSGIKITLITLISLLNYIR